MQVQFTSEKTPFCQAIQFSQAVLIQVIMFSISTDFVYTQLNSSILNKSVLCKYNFNVKKHFYFKLFSLVKQFSLP